MIGEQLVADIVEVADQRHLHAPLEQTIADMRNGGRRFVAVDGDAYELGAGARQRCDLIDGRLRRPAVSVLVIDCTTIGAPPPTMTPPTLTATVLVTRLGAPRVSVTARFMRAL